MSTIVQTANLPTTSGTQATTAKVTFGSPVSIGNIVVFAATFDSTSGATVSGFADGLGNTYSQVQIANDTTHQQALAVYWGKITVAGTCAPTITFGASHPFRAAAAVEIGGVTGTPVLDVSAQKTNASATTGANGMVGASVTPGSNGEIIVAAGEAHSGGTFTAGTNVGWTIAGTSGSGAASVALEKFDQATAAAVAGDFTISAATTFNAVTLAIRQGPVTSVTAGDTIVISDAAAGSFGGRVSIALVGDIIVISDFAGPKGGITSASDSFTTSSTAKVNGGLHATASNPTISITSTATYTNVTLHPTASDTIVTSSTARTNAGHVTTAADSFVASSAAQANTGRQAIAADSFATSSSAAVTNRSLHTTAADTFPFSSSAIGGKSGQTFASDSFSMSSFATQAVTVSIHAADTFVLSDHSTASGTHGLFATASDSFVITDTASLRAHVSSHAADSFALSDASTANHAVNAIALDGFTVHDFATTGGSFSTTASDTIVLTDQANVVFTAHPEFFLMIF